jgi:hypothetical protein
MRYRNISGQDLHVSVPGQGLVGVRNGEVIDIPDIPNTYVQTGETGEQPLFEAVSTGKSTPKE